jgi:DNA-binding response OmpR family regulator
MASILIVDDEFGLAEMAADLLSARGHTVDTAINGQLALKILEHSKPDVILLDVMMPVMSGFDVVRALRERDALRGTRIIIMSAAEDQVLPAEVKEVIAGFLPKPFSYDDLIAALEA